MKKIGYCLLLLSIVFSVTGCEETQSVPTTTTTAAATTTTTSSATTTTFSALSGQVKVPAAAVGSSTLTANDGISDTALAGAIITVVDASGNQIAGSTVASTDASGNFTIYNAPTDVPFYVKATKEVAGEIVVAKTLISMEGTSRTSEEINAKTTLTTQRIENILEQTSLTSFETLDNLSAADVSDLLNFQVGDLQAAPNLKAASENEVLENLTTVYNTLTTESTTLEAIDSSVNAQLLVDAAATQGEYKIAAWKFFDACGFAVPTIESLSLVGHAASNSALPSVPESVLDTMVEYLQGDYRWNISGIVTALNKVASWEAHYTISAETTSSREQTLLTAAILNANGGDISLPALNSDQTIDIISADNCPLIEEGVFSSLLYGSIPSYEGYVNQIRSLERPSSPSWETPSLIAVATLAFPASFWDITPDDASDNRTFNANTQLDILQAYSIVYYGQLKIQSFESVQEPPYYNHELRIQLADRPSLEAELLQHLEASKL